MKRGYRSRYKDKDWFKDYDKRNKDRYYKPSEQSSIKHKWTRDEIELILYSALSDKELSKITNHSIRAIQIKRSRITGSIDDE